MLVFHSNPTGKVVRCSCIIPLLHERLLHGSVSLRSYREGCYMFVYHSAPTGKVTGCSCIIALLHERLLDVSVSLRSYKEGC